MGGSGSFRCRFCSGFGGGFWRAAAGCEKKVDGFCVAGLTNWNDGGDLEIAVYFLSGEVVTLVNTRTTRTRIPVGTASDHMPNEKPPT